MHILKARFHGRDELAEAYHLEDNGGGKLFVPTTTTLQPKEEVIIELVCDGLPNKVLMRGTVQNWRPALPRLRVRAGAEVSFAAEEDEKWRFILDALAGKQPMARKRKHTRIPIEVHVRFRPPGNLEFKEGILSELSVGGALLRQPCPKFEAGSELVLEILPPGGQTPMNIIGRVAYFAPAGIGLRFIYRDGGGSRRIRELIRRIKVA